MTSLANIILSILRVKNKPYIEKKINALETQLTLNEVEKRIIGEIRENLNMDNILTPSYIQEKYSYYATEDDLIPEEPLQKETIDSHIVSLRIAQLKEHLSSEMLKLSSKVSVMSTDDIKKSIGGLYENALIEKNYSPPKDIFVESDDAYGDQEKERGSLSLLLDDIEKHTGKASLGTTVAILAAPGHGKTAYALNVAYSNAMQGNNMLYLTLEDTSEKLKTRLVLKHIAATAKSSKELIGANWVRDRTLSKEQKELYNRKHNDMMKKLGGHLIIWDTEDFEHDTFLDMEDTLRKADKQFRENTGKGLEAIFLDHVSLLKYTSGSGKKYGYDGAVINDWMLFFNNQALSFLDEGRKITFFPLSQVKREAFSNVIKPRNKGRYELDCAADSSEIERISTSMITLFKDTEQQGLLLVNIPKAREGFVPEHPIQTELHGEYFHVGPLDSVFLGGVEVEEDYFEDQNLNFEDLI
jgi:hypothetical protein